MRHVLETKKVFEQGQLLDAVIHMVINFLRAGQFVRFFLILRRFVFQHFQKNLVVASSQSGSLYSPELPRTGRRCDKALPAVFFSETREHRMCYFSLARTRNIGHIRAYWPTVKHPPYPHLTGKYAFSFVRVASGSASSWSASNPDSGVPRFSSSSTAR